MESGGVKIESHNLRDLLRIKEDDHRNNLNQSSSSVGGRRSSSGLTLLALLSEKIGPPQPADDEPLRNAQSSRTLYDIIREERMSGYGGGRSGGGRSWRQLRDKIRRRQAGNISSLSSTIPIPETDVPINIQHHNRHTDWYASMTNSAESTQPSVSIAPDVSNPISHGNPIWETETARGGFDQASSPWMNQSVIEGNSGDEESAERVDDRVEDAEEHAVQSGAADQPARTSLMTLLAENDRQMGLRRSAYMICEELKEEGGVDAAEYNRCCVCMVRDKGAAFIPCGHTFCRLCSRELWVQRGNCPICNNYILEILDIF